VEVLTDHRLIVQAVGRLADAGLRIDDDEFIIYLSRSDHRLKPNGLHTGPNNWNKRWGDFFKGHGNTPPDAKEIMRFLEELKREFGLL